MINNIIKFANAFEEAAYKERIYFNNLLKVYPNLFSEDKWIIDQTHYTDYTRYDYVLWSKANLYKRFIVEIKIRSEAYDNYVYETKKHKDLMKVKNLSPDDIGILYINSTPNGTYIWNIDKIIDNYKPIVKEMNIATMASRTDKEDKKVYMLDPKDATHYQFHFDEKQFNKYIESIKIEEEKKRRAIEGEKMTIEKLLFGK